MSSLPNPKAQMTVNEIVALLKKTNLPTVICEGPDDIMIYRRLEKKLAHLSVSVLAADGRDNLLQIFQRRDEIPVSVSLAFVADRDTWINTGVPTEYVAPLFCLTSGYSIENDVIADGKLEDLLVDTEVASYKKELEYFLEWYALALSRHLKCRSNSIADHPDQVLNQSKRLLLMALRDGEDYPLKLRAEIDSEYGMLVRGKSLLEILRRNLNKRPWISKYNKNNLLELGSLNSGELLEKITKAVERAITIKTETYKSSN